MPRRPQADGGDDLERPDENDAEAATAYFERLKVDDVIEPSNVIVRPSSLPETVPPGRDHHRLTDIPSTLMCQNVPVKPGQIFPVGEDRQIMVLDDVPSKDGMIYVQESYWMDPRDFGCEIRPQRIILEMTPEMAGLLHEELKNSADDAAVAVAADLKEVVKPEEEEPPTS